MTNIAILHHTIVVCFLIYVTIWLIMAFKNGINNENKN